MTTFAIDAAIIAVIAFCGWRGYKNGLIRGVFGIVALIASIFIANIAAEAYSEEFTGMLRPFISGIVESTLTEMKEKGIKYDPGANKHENKTEEFRTAYTVLRQLGMPEPSAIRTAELTAEQNEPDSGVYFYDLVGDKLSSSLAYVAVFAVAFILLAIIFAVIGNLVGFVFSLPGLKFVDIVAGAAFGLVKGALIVITLAAVVRYFGLLALDTLEETTILNGLVNNNPVANMLGI